MDSPVRASVIVLPVLYPVVNPLVPTILRGPLITSVA